MFRRIIRCLIFYAALGVLCFPFGRGLARTKFRPDAFPFASYFWEREGRIYARLRIREWQGLLPDVSRLFPGSVPRKELKGVEKPEDRLRLLINESCVAEVTHLVLCVLGLWAVHILPGQGGVTLWLLYVLLGNLPYILIQRYNRPMLMRTLERLLCRKRTNAPTEQAVDEIPWSSDARDARGSDDNPDAREWKKTPER